MQDWCEGHIPLRTGCARQQTGGLLGLRACSAFPLHLAVVLCSGACRESQYIAHALGMCCPVRTGPFKCPARRVPQQISTHWMGVIAGRRRGQRCWGTGPGRNTFSQHLYRSWSAAAGMAVPGQRWHPCKGCACDRRRAPSPVVAGNPFPAPAQPQDAAAAARGCLLDTRQSTTITSLAGHPNPAVAGFCTALEQQHAAFT